MLWGAGFLILILTAFLLSFFQYILAKRAISGLSVIVPDLNVNCGKDIEIRYESGRIKVIPGCVLRVCIEFYWHERVLKGQSLYSLRSQHGLISLPAKLRGEFSSPGAFFQINDVIGFFRFRIFSKHEEQLSVNPSLNERVELPRIMSAGGKDISRTPRKKRSDDLIETRQYYPGDDVRRLNWKTFAHLGELFIRQGEELPDPDSNLTIIPDFSGARDTAGDIADLNNYLDYLVSSLAGIIEHMRGKGVSVRILLPNGRESDEIDNYFLPGMWWSDEISDLKLSAGRRSSYLLVSSAFSNRAEKICRQISKTGKPVNAVVPLPIIPLPAVKRSGLVQIIFTSLETESQIYPEWLEMEAGALVSRLKMTLGGGINAAVI